MSASQQHRNRLNVCTAHVVTNGWTSTSESVSLNVRARRVLQFSNHRARTRPRTPKPHRTHLELWNNIFRTHRTAPDIGEPDAHTHIKWHVPEQIPLLLASGQSLSHSNGSIKSYPKSITVHFYYTWTDTNSFNCKLSGCFCAASPATFYQPPAIVHVASTYVWYGFIHVFLHVRMLSNSLALSYIYQYLFSSLVDRHVYGAAFGFALTKWYPSDVRQQHKHIRQRRARSSTWVWAKYQCERVFGPVQHFDFQSTAKHGHIPSMRHWWVKQWNEIEMCRRGYGNDVDNDDIQKMANTHTFHYCANERPPDKNGFYSFISSTPPAAASPFPTIEHMSEHMLAVWWRNVMEKNPADCFQMLFRLSFLFSASHRQGGNWTNTPTQMRIFATLVEMPNYILQPDDKMNLTINMFVACSYFIYKRIKQKQKQEKKQTQNTISNFQLTRWNLSPCSGILLFSANQRVMWLHPSSTCNAVCHCATVKWGRCFHPSPHFWFFLGTAKSLVTFSTPNGLVFD